MKYKIILVGPVPPPKGGMSIHIERLSRFLNEKNINHQVIDESRQKKSGVPHFRSMGILAYFGLIRKSDIVHIHSMNPFVRLAHTIAARLLGCKVVQTLHADRTGRLGNIALRVAGRMAHERIAVSEALIRRIGGKAHVIPAFLPPDSQDEELPEHLVRWLSDQKQDGRIIIAANASKIVREDGVDLYGIDMILDLFGNESIRDRFSAMICVGTVPSDDEYYSRLLERAERGPAGERIKFVRGEINFPGVLRRSDLFVRPSSRDGDAISLREALWYGIPAIASDVAVRPEGTVLFSSRDTGAFVEKILCADKFRNPNAGRRDFAEDVVGVYKLVGYRQ